MPPPNVARITKFTNAFHFKIKISKLITNPVKNKEIWNNSLTGIQISVDKLNKLKTYAHLQFVFDLSDCFT